MTLLHLLQAYDTVYAEEKAHQAKFLAFLQQDVPHCSRAHKAGHVTASAFVLNQCKTHFLLMHHRQLNRWFQPGGHLEPGETPLQGALRETMEETGMTTITPVSTEIYDLDWHMIPGKAQEPAHAHYDIRFILQAGSDELRPNGESKELRWIPLTQDTHSDIELIPSIVRMMTKAAPYLPSHSTTRPIRQ